MNPLKKKKCVSLRNKQTKPKHLRKTLCPCTKCHKYLPSTHTTYLDPEADFLSLSLPLIIGQEQISLQIKCKLLQTNLML